MDSKIIYLGHAQRADRMVWVPVLSESDSAPPVVEKWVRQGRLCRKNGASTAIRPYLGFADGRCRAPTKMVSELTRGVSGLTKMVSELTRGVSGLTKMVSELTRSVSGLTKMVSELTRGVSGLTKMVS